MWLWYQWYQLYCRYVFFLYCTGLIAVFVIYIKCRHSCVFRSESTPFCQLRRISLRFFRVCHLIALQQWFLLIFWDAEMTLQGPFMTPTHTNAIRVELLHFFFCQASQSKSEDIVSWTTTVVHGSKAKKHPFLKPPFLYKDPDGLLSNCPILLYSECYGLVQLPSPLWQIKHISNPHQ